MRGILVALALLTAVPAHALISVGVDWDGDLAVHGRWVWVEDVGDVWAPSVDLAWQPYLYGHWVWSPWGWMWVSDDPWGHLTDHYGRWLWTPHHGWVWVPGRIWAPAWVVWISGPGWVGWAPTGPDWCDGYWRHHDYHHHHDRWVVVHDHGFLSPSLTKELVPEHRVKAELVRELDYREKGGYALTRAPNRDAVQRVTGRTAPMVKEREGSSRTLERDDRWLRGREVAAPRAERERAPAPERSPSRERVREVERTPESRPAERVREAERTREPARPADQPSREVRNPEPRERQGTHVGGAPAASDRGQYRPEHARAPAAGRASRDGSQGRARR
jgi:hypothetical protein